ncbi:MAG TPA: hypothetical protein VGE01_01110 [Fimbriimonas sp.]
MTTIHAAPRGPKQPSGHYLSLTLQNGGKEPVALIAPRDELRKALLETGGVGRFDLQIGHDPTIHHAIACKVEKNPGSDGFNHVVVREVAEDDVVRMQVLLKVVDLPSSAKERRAQVVQRKRHLIVRGPFCKIPERVAIDLSSLEAGGSLYASDVPLPEGVELATEPTEELFAVRELIKP